MAEELWNAAHAQIRRVNEKLGRARLGGLQRTEQSRQYLFSGLLVCGECGSRMVIISGRGKRGYVKYGCPSHRYRGVCANRLTMRQDRLEEQMLGAIETRILTPEMIPYTVQRFTQELEKRLSEMRKQAGQSSPALSTKTRGAASAGDAGGPCHSRDWTSATLLSRSTTAEAELTRVDGESRPRTGGCGRRHWGC